MSTQVTYKGNTIANFTNDTKTLKTAGKYMEDDVTITEVIAGQGNVWQDEDGYVHLDDESGLDFQAKSVNPTESSQTVKPDAGYTALSQVTVGAISSTYVGTGIARKSSTDLTASGSTVTVPVGYYSAQATKNVAAGTATTPATTITANPTFTIVSSTGKLTASYTGSSNITPTIGAGYITAGTAGKVTTTGTSTYTLATQAAQTITPTETQQTIASYRWLTGTQTIAAISSNYVGTNIARKSAADLTAAGSTVTVPIGYYSSQVTKNISGGTATTPAVTITTNPTFTFTSSTGKLTATYTGSSNVTPTVTAGYITTGTSGKITTTGTSTYTLTTKPAMTYNVSTTDRTIASYYWLTGAQTIKSVVTSNLIASNIKSGAMIEVGDADNTSRIARVYGTYVPTLISKIVTPTKDIQVVTAGTFVVTKREYVDITQGVRYTTAISLESNTKYSIHVIFEDEDEGAGTYDQWVDVNYSSGSTILINYPIGTALLTIKTNEMYIDSQYANPHGYLAFTIYKKGEADGLRQVTVNGDSNLIASNIAEGVSIFGVTGTHTGGSTYLFSWTAMGQYSSSFYITHKGSVKYGSAGSFAYTPGDEIVVWEKVSANYTCYLAQDYLIYSTYNIGTTSSWVSYNCTSLLKGGDYSIVHYPPNNPTGKVVGLNLRLNNTYDVLSRVAFRDSLSTINRTAFSSWITGLSNIPPYLFAGPGVFPSSTSYVTFPNVSLINYAGFGWAYTLYTTEQLYLSFPKLISLNAYAFQYNGSVRDVYAPICEHIGSYAFSSCSNLTKASFPSCTYVGSSAFISCSNLTQASFPVLQLICDATFLSCSKLTTAYAPSCSKIGFSAFGGCTSLTQISFPICTIIGSSAFARCANLSIASFPECSNLWDYGFTNCAKLTTAYFPKCSTIGPGAFYSCSSLVTVNFSSATSVGFQAFYSCSNLPAINSTNFPAVQSIGLSAFVRCTAISVVSLSYCTNIGSSAFSYCTSLQTVYLPAIVNISQSAFYSCTSLNTVVLGSNLSSMEAYVFHTCRVLLSAYVLATSIPVLSTNPFYLTPIGGNTASTGGVSGSIFVRQSLLTSFKTATVWSVYSSRMVGLTDAQVQNVLNYGRHDP